MSNYSRRDCSIKPTLGTRLNFTIDDLRALISSEPAWYRQSLRRRALLRAPRFPFSSLPSFILAARYCDPEPWLFINHPVVSMTDWVTDGRREVLYTYGVRANADARRGDLSRLWWTDEKALSENFSLSVRAFSFPFCTELNSLFDKIAFSFASIS